MQEPTPREVEKAMMEGGYRFGAFVKTLRLGLGKHPCDYELTMYTMAGKKGPELVVNKVTIEGNDLDGLLRKADKPVCEEPLPGVAMYKKVPTLADAFSQ